MVASNRSGGNNDMGCCACRMRLNVSKEGQDVSKDVNCKNSSIQEIESI
jgi:hypothetical protein